ncbi:uncharacterized protein A4U43_C01F19320 [Asparagus officinalis]|uniref:Uncharacterized protein n=1 Tax=Asparagus officinalis TaxID=4686 RepID=A0A5P1FR70_ASPOF|nr:uncharacterized protein A4U43_C01F19320 [Asparagus officinalis]
MNGVVAYRMGGGGGELEAEKKKTAAPVAEAFPTESSDKGKQVADSDESEEEHFTDVAWTSEEEGEAGVGETQLTTKKRYRTSTASPPKSQPRVPRAQMAISLKTEIIMSRVPRGRSPTVPADGVLPSYAVEYPSRAFSSHAVDERCDEYYSTSNDFSPIPLTLQFVPGTSTEVAQVVKEGGHRALRQLITDAPFVKDASSIQSLRKTDFLFGDSVRDPDVVFIDAEQWLYKNSGGFIYLPKIPRHCSLTELRRQAVKREMLWRLTEEHESIHCGYITHQAAPGSSRSHIIGLRPGVLGLDAPPRNEFLASVSTLSNRLVDLGREMPAARHRFYGWVHSLDKLWWTRLARYVLSRWSEELHACGLYAAIRASMYGLPVSAKHFFALYKLYNPDSNTFLTRHGELGLALHEMHKIYGLPMGQMLYQEYFPSNHELTKRTKSYVSLKQFASYLFRNLESNSGEAICELAPLTPSGVNSLLKKIGAHSYTISSPESGFPAGTKFKSFLWHATAPIRPMTLLAGYLAIWLKKCVIPYQSGDALPLEVLYPAVQLAYKKELSLLPVMVANIHRGLRQISSAFSRKESESSAQIPTIKVELPYTYLMAWFVLHRSDMMSVPNATDHSVPLLQLLENGKWEGRGFPDIRKQLQCFIEPYLPYRFARQFGYDQLYVGNPRQQLRTHGGLVDGLRAWLWTVTGCTGVKFSLLSAERQLNLTFLSCRWLLAANKTVPVKPIEELVAEKASQVDSHVIREHARSQRTRSKTRRIDAEGNKAFSSAGEASGGDPEDYEEDFERGTATDSEEEFRPFTRARPSTVAPAARRKKLVRKPRADPRASDMDLACDDSARDGGEHEEGEMSLDPAPQDFVSSDATIFSPNMFHLVPIQVTDG